MTALPDGLDAVTDGFSGVVSASRGETVLFERAYGLADRAHRIPNTVDTQFGIASGTKGFTALTVAALVGDGVLTMSTTARSLLGVDLPLIDDEVTVEHLLTHTSGIGDYVDEESDLDADDYVLQVPVHTLAHTEGYLAAMNNLPAKFGPGERFGYCNGGYVVLALMAERAAGRPFHDLVAERVWQPAGMTDTAFLRMDDLPGRAAIGYLANGPTNVLHLPVRGSGDGGAFSTVADVRAFWLTLFLGQILPAAQVGRLLAPHIDTAENGLRYGHGFWLAASGPQVLLQGGDAGVAFQSTHDPTTGTTRTIMSNTDCPTSGIDRRLVELLGG